MSEIVQNVELVSQGIAHLLEQYKESEKLKALLGIYLEELQEVEDATADVVWRRFLGSAQDAQLDVIGALVGELRQGKTDDAYGIWIAARIRLNRSFGRPDDVIACIKLVTDAPFVYEEYSSAFFTVTFLEPPEFPNDITAITYLAKAVGVGMLVIYPFTEGGEFLFRDFAAADDPDHGFSDFNFVVY